MKDEKLISNNEMEKILDLQRKFEKESRQRGYRAPARSRSRSLARIKLNVQIMTPKKI
jgi:hypothetical protein